jgi:hypothetical protein
LFDTKRYENPANDVRRELELLQQVLSSKEP